MTRICKILKRSVSNFKRLLKGEQRYDAAYYGNAAKLYLGIEGRSGDESCTVWFYRVIGGKINKDESGLIFPVSNKAVIMYCQKGGPGSWYPEGEIGTKYKIVLSKNYVGKMKIIKL